MPRKKKQPATQAEKDAARDKRMGRPKAVPLEADGYPSEQFMKQLRGTGALTPTYAQAASALGISKQTLVNLFNELPEVKEAFDEAKANRRLQLRQAQWNAAIIDKNITMQIWLGKQELEQTDRRELTGKGGGPMQVVDLTKLTSEELNELERILGPLARSGDDVDGNPERAGETEG